MSSSGVEGVEVIVRRRFAPPNLLRPVPCGNQPEWSSAVLSRAAVRCIALRDDRTNWHERAWRDAARSAAPRRLFVADDAPLLAVAHKAGQEAERAQIVR
mmetsp:Transcript_30810/g.98422  ORF Transcript_30810/g.98422 Transcript_30810/m.98422 type:complete len:100 (-) Transcript_30810:268-567(-)